MVGDPIPFRHGAFYNGGGMLTKGEMKKVVEVLKDAASKKTVLREPVNDEDLWVAFVSLLRGHYILESPPGSHKYILSDKGKQYLKELET
jgi:hypothetical protein